MAEKSIANIGSVPIQDMSAGGVSNINNSNDNGVYPLTKEDIGLTESEFDDIYSKCTNIQTASNVVRITAGAQTTGLNIKQKNLSNNLCILKTIFTIPDNDVVAQNLKNSINKNLTIPGFSPSDTKITINNDVNDKLFQRVFNSCLTKSEQENKVTIDFTKTGAIKQVNDSIIQCLSQAGVAQSTTIPNSTPKKIEEVPIPSVEVIQTEDSNTATIMIITIFVFVIVLSMGFAVYKLL